MSNITIEDKLRTVFPEPYQVKRVSKCKSILTLEILNLKELREKGIYDMKMSIINAYGLKFNVRFESLSLV